MVKGIEIGSAGYNGTSNGSQASNGADTGNITYIQLNPGERAPWFHQRTPSNPRYAFDTAAGRWIVLLFAVTGSDETGQACQLFTQEHRDIFNDKFASLFVISQDPTDESEGRFGDQMPGLRVFWDFDATIARLYGIVPTNSQSGQQLPARRMWMVLDPTMRVKLVVPFQEDGSDRDTVASFMRALPSPSHFVGQELQAPILYLPDVFEPALCEQLIALHRADGGVDSGFMQEVDGKTVLVSDPNHKRRSDFLISDQNLIATLQNRILRRIVPEIRKVHQFNVTRMERYLVGCYKAENSGHFRQHRDNTTSGTAHRRFAVSINLNADFQGGDLSFPEYGPRLYKPEPGTAVVFSCSLLHAVSPVTQGQRYAFLPFLYDDAAAAVREKNNARLDTSVSPYSQTPM
jgi:predicted 2-oxoglutarate/Fe(II)-dependent dioxygenase YbiX/peroxiredoxin